MTTEETPDVPTAEELETMTVRQMRKLIKDQHLPVELGSGTAVKVRQNLLAAFAGFNPQPDTQNTPSAQVKAPKTPRDPRTDGKVFLPEWDGLNPRQVAARRAVLTMRANGTIPPAQPKAPVDPKRRAAALKAWETMRARTIAS